MKNLKKIVLLALGLVLTSSVFAQSIHDFPSNTYVKEYSPVVGEEGLGLGLLKGKIKRYKVVKYDAVRKFGEWEPAKVERWRIVELDQNGRRKMLIDDGDTTRYVYNKDGLLAQEITRSGTSLYEWVMREGKPIECTTYWQAKGATDKQIKDKQTFNQQGNRIVRDSYKNGQLSHRKKYSYDYGARKRTLILYDSDGKETQTETYQYNGNTIQYAHTINKTPRTPEYWMKATFTIDGNRSVIKSSGTVYFLVNHSFTNTYKYVCDSKGNITSALEVSENTTKDQPEGTIYKIKYEYYE